jgi:N-methylhydantoinase A/acetophenone carboxylase
VDKITDHGGAMKLDLAIEVGIAFSEGFFRDDAGRREGVKVKTTPHNLMECFVDCISEGAKRWGISSTAGFIGNLDAVRISTPAVCHDALVEGTRLRVGLIVTDGFENSAYFEKGKKGPVVGHLVDPEMVMGVREQVSVNGERLMAPDVGQVREVVRLLLESGAASIVISLRNASTNPVNEETIREMIESDYPKHFLGAVPISISTEVSNEADDFTRTSISLSDAYLRQATADFLDKAAIFLGNHKFNGSLSVVT